jgi:hypothetical protein
MKMRAREGKSVSCVMGIRLIMALTVFSLAGCGIVTHQDVMVEMTAVQEEIAESLEAVTSVEEAKEAAPTIEFLVMKWKLLQYLTTRKQKKTICHFKNVNCNIGNEARYNM